MNSTRHLRVDGYEPWTVSAICIILAPLTGLGAVGNIINIKTFFHLGISDGVNMSLITLAASDLLYLISAFIISVSLLLHGVEELSSFKIWFPVDPRAIYSVFTSTGSVFYAISMLVTTFITVVRCLAVAHPLRYRNLISWKTTVIIISLFTVLSVTGSVITLAFLGILPQFDININRTRPILWLSPKRAVIKDTIYGMRDVFLPLASQLIVGICVWILARYLLKASKFRQNLFKNLSGNAISFISDPLRTKKALAKESPSAKLVGKELQVVRQMLLIAVVYILCNMPKVVFNLTIISLADFYTGGRYSNVYLTCNIIRELIQSLNASVTIFIYWKYNSKFRNAFNLHL